MKYTRVNPSNPSLLSSNRGLWEFPSQRPVLAKWYEYNRRVKIHDYELPKGLIYIGPHLPDRYKLYNDACLINPSLKATHSSTYRISEKLPEYPRYNLLSPIQRGAYLAWLAGKRSAPKADIGFLFLFFYGLERRMFMDGQQGKVFPKERVEIITEVKRLLQIYGENKSFQNAATRFLAMAWAVYQSNKIPPPYVKIYEPPCSEAFKVLLVQHMEAEKPLPSSVAFHWIFLHLKDELVHPSLPPKFLQDLQSLFTCRYLQNFRRGLIVTPNSFPLKIEYEASNPTIIENIIFSIPNLSDPAHFTSSLRVLRLLFEKCIHELEPSRRSSKNKRSRASSWRSLLFLPQELRYQSPSMEENREFLKKKSQKKGKLIKVEELYQGISDNFSSSHKIDSQEKVSVLKSKEAEAFTEMVEDLGFGIVPDIRYLYINLKLKDTAIIYQNHGEKFNPSDKFSQMALLLRLCASLTTKNDKKLSLQNSVIQSFIQKNQEFSIIEKKILLFFFSWSLKNPKNRIGLKKQISETHVSKRRILSRTITFLFYSGREFMIPEKLRKLEKIYTKLGIDPKKASEDLHLIAAGTEPFTAYTHKPLETFSIPQPLLANSSSEKFHLNKELIEIREQESLQLQKILEQVFCEPNNPSLSEDTEQNRKTTTETMGTERSHVNLDQEHQSLLEQILTQDTWSHSELNQICNRLGLMVHGSIELLNEWAMDKADAPLIESGDSVYVDRELAKEILHV